MTEADGWDRWQKLVLQELERGQQERQAIRAAVVTIQIDIARLKTGAAVWGAVAGIVGAGIVSTIVALLTQ